MQPLRGWFRGAVLSLAVATPVNLTALIAGLAAVSPVSASVSASASAAATATAAAAGAAAARAWSPIVVDDVVPLGAQVSPELTNVSRDGGHSVLLNRRVVWLYADTECIGADGARLSFASNTAAYAAQPRADIAAVRDFGLVAVGRNAFGDAENAVLAPDAVGGGGWVPFGAAERRYNELNQGKRRIAIWPGTNPVPLNKTHALLYAPVVHVDTTSADPANIYQQRGVTLISVTAPVDGPKAVRINPLLFHEHESPFGVFAAVVGSVGANSSASGPLKQNNASSSSSSGSSNSENGRADVDVDKNRYVYLLGVATAGLQLARVPLGQANDSAAYTYFRPRTGMFGRDAPPLNATNTTTAAADVYLAGSFSYGTLFHSPYFGTFVLVYMNKLADSTFYIRFLDLRRPRASHAAAAPKMDGWLRNGTRAKDGRSGGGGIGGGIGGIGPEDVDALARYAWSPAQVLHRTPPGKGGYSYAGAVHPEYFSRHYYPRSPAFTASDIAASASAAASAVVSSGAGGSGGGGGGGGGGESEERQAAAGIERGEWFGGYEVPERDAGGDGRHLLLSWTAQARGGFATGIYQVQLARVAFGAIPVPPPPPPSPPFTNNSATIQTNATITVAAATPAASRSAAATSALPTKRPQTIPASSSSSASTHGTPFIFVGRTAAAAAAASMQRGGDGDGTALLRCTVALLAAVAAVFGYM